MQEALKDYLKVESDCSENNSSYNEYLNDNKSHSEENTNESIWISTCSENISPQSNWRLPDNSSNNTLPEGLSIRGSKLPNAVYGVYATREIKKDTIFGPYVGTREFDIQFTNNSGRMWKIFMNNKFHHYIDGQDPENSNWMKYVNYAGRAELQNLESFQYGYKIYYRAIVDIQEDAELLVWYSEDYNQDCLNGKLKKLNQDKTLLIPFGSKCQSIGHTASNNNAPTAVTDNLTCDSNLYNAEGIKKKTQTKTHTNEKLFECVLCNVAFAWRGDLRRHMRTHTGEKPYKCDICNTAFTQSGSLKTHRRIHTGEKPYKCDVCNVAFAWRAYLTTHRRTHTGEKPYKCDVCNIAFTQRSSLKTHSRIHTGEKPYNCDVCNAAFARRSDMRIHVRMHTGEKPYKCDVCNSAFAKSSYLKTHKRIHTGEKPFECDVCNATFTSSSNWNVHRKTCTDKLH